MLRFFLQSIKMGYIKAFDCYGKDSKWQYLCIMAFQLAWFLFYLWIPYRSDYAILLFLLFLFPSFQAIRGASTTTAFHAPCV